MNCRCNKIQHDRCNVNVVWVTSQQYQQCNVQLTRAMQVNVNVFNTYKCQHANNYQVQHCTYYECSRSELHLSPNTPALCASIQDMRMQWKCIRCTY